MDRAWAVGALLLAGCFGGQTGEITELAACHEPIGTVDVGEASAAGRSAIDQLAALTTARTADVIWSGRDATALTASFAASGERATLLGGPRCARPWLEVPVIIAIETADGALDETIEGSTILADMDTASVQGAIAPSEMHGTLDLGELDPSLALLRVHLLAEPSSLAGQLSIDPGTEGAPLRALASF